MNRAALARAIISVLVLAGAFTAAFTMPATLGLDLEGGTQITLEAKDTADTKADAEAADQVKSVMQRRVDALGVKEPTITRSGENRIIVEMPGYDDVDQAAKQLGRTAQLTIHPVLGVEGPQGQQPQMPGQQQQQQGPQPLPGPLQEQPQQPRAPEKQQGPMMPGGSANRSVPDAAEEADQAAGSANAHQASAQQTTGGSEAANEAAATSTGSTGSASEGSYHNASATTGAAAEPASVQAAETDEPPKGSDSGGNGGSGNQKDQQSEPKERVVPSDQPGEKLRIGPAAIDGDEINDALGQTDPQQASGWFVTMKFNGAGGDTWKKMTADAACKPQGDPQRRIAIVLDGKAISSPDVQPSVQCGTGIGGGETMITGDFSEKEAQDLGALIKGGALPLPVDIIEQRNVGPSLGAEAIDASKEAAIIGLALTAVFLVVVYRLMGFLVTLALGCYTLISFAMMVALGMTFTLPGLAGFVLAIGMAIDANVLIFERAREEYADRPGRGLRGGLTSGFKGAWSAIIDTNVTTILAAGLLFFLASGPVRGFGVSLSIGVVASLISALIIARFFTEWAASRKFVGRRPGITGLHTIGRVRTWITQRSPDLMKNGRTFIVVTVATMVLALAGVAVRGLEFGIDFTGGRQLEYSTAQSVDVTQARDVITNAGYPDAVVQKSDGDNLSIRIENLSNSQENELRSDLSEVGGQIETVQDNQIGPTLGDELRTKGLIALGIALLAQMVYLAIRFRWTFGAAAMVAMFHDVIAVLGLFAWLGKTIDSTFLAAALTIIGLSVNDTVVVFDRVREIWQKYPKDSFARSTNTAILQTVPRTVNTGLGAMFILAALVILGGSSLQDFALAMFVGLLVGTYSSITLASPLAIEFQKRSKYNRPPSAGMTKRASGQKRAQDSSSGAVV